MTIRVLVAISVLQVFGGIFCLRDCNSGSSIKIKENLSINDTVCTIADIPTDVDLSISHGNKHLRFRLDHIGEFWHLNVARLLDYDITNSFNLEIKPKFESPESEKYTSNVQITLEDLSDWPLHYNHDCSHIFRTEKTKNPYAIEAEGNVTAPFIGGKYSLSTVNPKRVGIDMDNDKCHLHAFGVVVYDNDTFIDVGGLVRKFNPDRDIKCSPLTRDDKNKWPAIKLWLDPKNTRPQNPVIKDSWFQYSGDKAGVLIDIDFEKVYTERISKWNCTVDTHIFAPAVITLDLSATGCPKGKYGGNCNKNCTCENNSTCHPFNGACDCAPGWKAPDCTIEYQAVDITPKRQIKFYGDELMLTCKSYHVRESDVTIEWEFNNAPITQGAHIRTKPGESILTIPQMKDSDAGVYKCVGKIKNQRSAIFNAERVQFGGCHYNLYGEQCERGCNCENGAPCDRYEGCLCDVHKYWGPTCSRDCQCENNATCAKEDGDCDCLQWTWGRNCQKNCDCAEGASNCNHDTGVCVCFLGWSGDKCDFDLKKPAFVIGMTVTGIVILIVIVIVLVKYRRQCRYQQIKERKLLSSSVLLDEENDVY
ncbi:uncharacterized protein LOC144441201 [Glandiceps talaboti]